MASFTQNHDPSNGLSAKGACHATKRPRVASTREKASRRRHSMPELCSVVWTAFVPFNEIAPVIPLFIGEAINVP